MLKYPKIVAELSANHNQDLNLAKESICAIKESGADFVKLQTYTPDCMTLKENPFIIQGTLWNKESLYELYQKASTPLEWHAELFELARKLDLGIFSSPFSLKALELLESLDCAMYKIASFEIADLELIEKVARTQKPIILSSGIATLTELQDAITLCREVNHFDITLLKCVSAYPSKLEDAHLLSMVKLGEKFGVKFGLSDHTIGSLCPILATTLGASMIEKHFILNKSIQTPDSAFSMDFNEFKNMVKEIKQSVLALGKEELEIDKETLEKRRIFARSLFVIKDIQKGEAFTSENIKALRPNLGLHPKFYKEILGKKATKFLKANTPLQASDIEQ
ncbi:pseudaminic acid synthase [Helicobacter cetorum]|uniref:Pseudaminic acid synthase n=1 Tax=Helicobacter cetorum (strain ATCC BAA-429 / MIT 00-7128) TaxID=182217 RepID=I0EM55_HELC0|nr:pseudaminic acid synthase [Helicobacter cetorum]AFI04024.1 sialic acid synthase [Helicobacter cetorum MIT 00-7128]